MTQHSKQENRYAEVAFAIPVRQTFTYKIPYDWRCKLSLSARVLVPFGKRKEIGYVVAIHSASSLEPETIKPISKVIDGQALFPAELRQFLEWVADYYLCSQGEVYAAAYPFAVDAQPKTQQVAVLCDSIRSTGQVPDDITSEKQQKVLRFLMESKTGWTRSGLAAELGVSASPIQSLEKKGYLYFQESEMLRSPHITRAEPQLQFSLSEEQENAIACIEESLQILAPKPILIQGVTGSGKTEVYLQAIERVLKQGKNALVLIPEISLSPQTMDRFRMRFGDWVGILHSGLGAGERFDEWRLAKQGVRRIIVGTRSAIFAPLYNLGMIIVDEEHESSYKQSDPNPRYNSRDLAVVRAKMNGGLCLLGSATPSVESRYNVYLKKYRGVRLTRRIAKHGMPVITLLDMRGRAEEETIFASEMRQAILGRYQKNQQTILFLNRRGFATTLTCKHCGQILSCRHCSVAMVYHRSSNLLICHHCNYRMPLPQTCPHCNESFLKQRGFGTERVVHELEEMLPEAQIIRMDRDTTAKKGEHDRLLSVFRKGEAHVLVGTQMIAKGLDFPNVTLVGIINADYTLTLPDFRASERTFTLLTQVAGRAGRGTHAGEVLIQSYCPDHYSMQLAIHQNYDQFYEKEIRYRRMIGFPPFSRLVMWRIEAMKEDFARGKAWELYDILKTNAEGQKGLTVLPPVEAPIYRIRNYYRWQIALKSTDYMTYRPVVNETQILKIMNSRRQGVRIVQDVDPWDML